MFKNLLVWILKKSYNKTIMKVVVLDKHNNKYYREAHSFCTLELGTDLGPFVFEFKEDRRKTRGWLSRLIVRTYIVHLKPPAELIHTRVDLSEKVVIAVKIMVFRPNYEILTQVLMDIYLDVMLKET